MAQEGLPLPVPTLDNKEFWDYCKRHQLVIRRCQDCHVYSHPPRPTCPSCASSNLEWAPASGRGKVYSYVISMQPVHPGLVGRVPWAVAVVELEEGVQLVGNVVDCKPEEIRIGMPVEVVFEEVTDEITLPKFKKVEKN